MRCGSTAVALLLFLALDAGAARAGDGEDAEAARRGLQQPGHAGLLRHAHAPGVADDPDMELDDCSTQRELDAKGREQARAIGERLRAHGVDDRAVYTSRMCRAIDTAELLDVGGVRPLPGLDSYFGDDERRESILTSLRTFLRTDMLTPPPILVTHTPNIREISGEEPKQGGMVVVRVTADGDIETVGSIPPPKTSTAEE